MKLSEIFDADVSDRATTNAYGDKHYDANVSRQARAEERSHVGHYGRIHQDVNDPHMVHKFNHQQTYLEGDAYLAYVRDIAESRIAQSNPFAPRVYGIRSVSDQEGNGRYKVKIEKLKGIHELSDQQLMPIAATLFNQVDIDRQIQYNDGENIPDLLITGLMYRLFHKRIKSTNRLLNDIVERVHSLKGRDGNTFRIDMHSGNFMFRLSSRIPQLVVTDPLAN